MAQKKKISRDLIIIAGLSVITVLLWIGITVYQSLVSPTIPKVLQEQLRPIRPDFDTQVLNTLNLRRTISERDLENLPPRILRLVEEGQSSQAGSTASAALTTTPESSPGAQTL